MKLAIMTKSTFFVEEDKILSSLFDEGMDNLHLFKPGSSPMYAERLLTLLPEDYLRKITVHDHYYLKQEYDLAGIHIDDPLAPVPDGYKGKFSRTCTDLSMLKEMKKKSNYVFLKNILYALGGMSLENLKIAKEFGFGGVVICGDLWNRFDIHNERDFKELILHFEKLRKAIS